jgi:hypothetical protein
VRNSLLKHLESQLGTAARRGRSSPKEAAGQAPCDCPGALAVITSPLNDRRLPPADGGALGLPFDYDLRVGVANAPTMDVRRGVFSVDYRRKKHKAGNVNVAVLNGMISI